MIKHVTIEDNGRVVIERGGSPLTGADLRPGELVEIEIPAFLRRTDRLPDEELRRITHPNEQREWVMPDMSKYGPPAIIEEDNMAKADFLIENRAAPVHVYQHPVGADPKPFHVFPDVEAFEAWYQPRKVRFCGQNTTGEFTDVLLDIPPGTPSPSAAFPVRAPGASTGSPSRRGKDPLRPPPAVKTPKDEAPRAVVKAPSGKFSGKTVQEGMRYIDSRHVELMEKHGLVNQGTWPHTFKYGKVTVDFEPPPPGRRWATTWSIPGAAGRGVATLFQALGVKGVGIKGGDK
jgi:hypothetical protein